MVVMGGPQDVWKEDQYPLVPREKAAIRNFVLAMRRPYLGICLGHQLLADATGRVGLAQSPEVGVLTVSATEAGRRDPLLRALPNPMTVLQWHGAEVTDLPPNAETLAQSDASAAFRPCASAATPTAFDVIVEITADTVGQWAVVPGGTRARSRAPWARTVPPSYGATLSSAFRNSTKTRARSMRVSKAALKA